MISTTLQSALCLCLSPLLVVQQVSSRAQSASDSDPAAQATNSTITLRKGTVMELLLLETVSSATAQKGQTVRLAVAKDVIVDGTVVIPRGAPASGVITHVRKGVSGKRDGNLELEPVSLMLPDGSTMALRKYTPTGGDGVCEGFGNCLGLFVVAVPYAIVVGVPVLIAEMAKELFTRHHVPEQGIDVKMTPCGTLWGWTTTKSRIDIAVPNQTQPSHPTINIEAICPSLH